MDWMEALLFFAVLLALCASARAAGRAQGTAGRRKASGAQAAARAEKARDGADTAEQKPLYTALDNLTAYGTNRQQTEVEDRHEIWDG